MFAGGNVVVSGESVVGTTVNADGIKVGCAEVALPTTWPDGARMTVTGLPGYGTDDIYAIGGTLGLWPPAGTHSFVVSATGLSGEVLNKDVSNVTSPWKDSTATAGAKYKYWIEAVTDKGSLRIRGRSCCRLPSVGRENCSRWMGKTG